MALSTLDECRLIDVNQAFVSVTGYLRQEVLGRTEAELQLWGSDAVRLEIRDAVLKQGHVHSKELQLRTKRDETVHYLLSAEKLELNGQACVLSVMQDITERKRSQQDLLAAIDAVMQDTSWFSQRIIEKLANLTRAGDSAVATTEVAELSPRERDVISLLARGMADADIAAKLGLSAKTVRNHIMASYTKIGVNRRAAAVVWARERGLDADTAKPMIKHGKTRSLGKGTQRTR